MAEHGTGTAIQQCIDNCTQCHNICPEPGRKPLDEIVSYETYGQRKAS